MCFTLNASREWCVRIRLCTIKINHLCFLVIIATRQPAKLLTADLRSELEESLRGLRSLRCSLRSCWAPLAGLRVASLRVRQHSIS